MPFTSNNVHCHVGVPDPMEGGCLGIKCPTNNIKLHVHLANTNQESDSSLIIKLIWSFSVTIKLLIKAKSQIQAKGLSQMF